MVMIYLLCSVCTCIVFCEKSMTFASEGQWAIESIYLYSIDVKDVMFFWRKVLCMYAGSNAVMFNTSL